MLRLDLVIFGATGFTGRKAAEEVVRGGKYYDDLLWGVAGRSRDKLEALIKELTKLTGRDLSNVRIIVADVKDEPSLKAMCAQTKILVNCCGPYQFYGEPVVRAAIQAKSNYVDITAEPQFAEKMQLLYDEQARAAGIYIVTTCGFDCIPNDMGVEFLKQHFDGVLNSVESYVSVSLPSELNLEAVRSGIVNFGTWESIVNIQTNRHELATLRNKLYPDTMPEYKPKLKSRGAIHKRDGRYCIPFTVSADHSVVNRTQRELYRDGHRPVQFRAYFKFSNFLFTLLLAFAQMMLILMTKAKFTTQLLLTHPRLFTLGMVSRKGPKEQVMNNMHFKFELVGRGWEKGADIESAPPNKTLKARVSGLNPGYGATVVALIHCGLTMLREQDKMPGTGGVMTTALAFSNTSLIQRLNENNFKFEIIDNS
ncbi:saccharopine dehydrogenase-like oxidoreductase [Galleria mellonella]|uniref:Saccharopine dehydrogenase-like oxidoreductase n=1 Tax=Galleria mellonella TaxID=7137 RepID=A0A6J1WUW1_GALME|nr:saccharopine dehydrogenase-like oxidoreductase [Galleria mellonella]